MSGQSAPNASSGRTPVPTRNSTSTPCVSSSSATIASISSHVSNGSISPTRGAGFFTSAAGFSSIHFQRTAASSTWRSARCAGCRRDSGSDLRQFAIRCADSSEIRSSPSVFAAVPRLYFSHATLDGAASYCSR